MRITIPHAAERLGAVLVHSIQKVFELDSGLSDFVTPDDRSFVRRIPYDEIYERQKNLVVVVPMINERIRMIEGVLCGIPNQCLTVIVSNSPRTPVDRYAIEKHAFERYASFTNKRVIVVHQKDPILSEALQEAGYSHVLDEETGLIKDGKAEGMILGTLLARMSGCKYLGFIDADNYFPGAVLEYVQEYAAGFAMSHSKHAMVRIFWHSKPKIVNESLFFARWGRTSRQTNHYLNSLIADYTGFETDIIQTGNAGEHAMTMDLAMLLGFSSGYSIEPFHFIDMFEKFGGLGNPIHRDVAEEPIEIYQIESRNPHLHDAERGEEHIDGMTYAAMQVIYYSSICPESLKNEIKNDMKKLNFSREKKHPPKVAYYPALKDVNIDVFLKAIQDLPYSKMLENERKKLNG